MKTKFTRELQCYMWQCSKYRNINKVQSIKLYQMLQKSTFQDIVDVKRLTLIITSEAGLLIWRMPLDHSFVTNSKWAKLS